MRAATGRSRFGRIIAMVILAGLLASLAPGVASAGDGRYRDRWLMKRETNQSRLRHEVRRLSLDERLSELARRHSVKMAKRNSLFHTSDPASFYLRGVKWHYWGENVGVTGGDVPELERAFMASAPHRANILNRRFRHVAIGAIRARGALWVTVFFYG
jgi:uncharacterized protein YkwD